MAYSHPEFFIKNTKRGRPKKDQSHSKATKELQQKKKLHLTDEPLDLLHHKKLISPVHYKIGIYFRKLHALRYGIVSLQSYDLQRIKGRETRCENMKWQTKQEQLYKRTINMLQKTQSLSVVSEICIYKRVPMGLMCPGWVEEHIDMASYLQRLYFGLESIYQLWKKEGVVMGL